MDENAARLPERRKRVSAVEFFFALAGFTLAMSAHRRHLARDGAAAAPKKAADRALGYAKAKLLAIVPVVLCWLVLHILVAPGLEDFRSKLDFLMNAEWEVLLMVGTPMGWKDEVLFLALMLVTAVAVRLVIWAVDKQARALREKRTPPAV